MADLTPPGEAPVPFAADEVERSIPDRLRELAHRCPDDPALSHDDVAPVSFAELWSSVEAAGRSLLTYGLDPGGVVAVLMPHETIAIATQLATLAAGFTVTPLDHLDTSPSLKGYLEEAQPVALICTTALHEKADELGYSGPLLVWDELPSAPADAPDLPPVSGSDPAYLLFTSGSTARPKGATTLHRAFLRPAREVCQHGMYHRGDRVALAAPLAFMAAVDTTLWVLGSGAELCLFSIRERGPAAFAQWMGSQRITGWGTAVAALRAMAGALSGRPLPALRVVMVGGEVMHSDDLPLFASMSSVDLDLIPVYASTEIPLVAWQIIPTSTTGLTGPVPIGRAAEGNTLELQPVHGTADDAEQGEIVVRCPIGSLGYLAITDAADGTRFAFDVDADEMTYRTGDLGRRLPSGSIEIVGRTDTVVKIRGMRVHLSAVEAALRAHPDVTDAVALTIPDGIGGLSLVGHVATGTGVELAAADIRSMLRRNVPEHMVPTRLVVHAALPMTARGKIDRTALADVSEPEPGRGRAPRTDTERRLVAIFESLLDEQGLGIDDDFFELGGDSLHAVELLVALEQEFGLWQPLSTWIDSTTVAAIAATIAAGPRREGERITRIQVGEPARPPIVVAYDLHGGAFRFKPLAAAMGADQEVWGLENPMLDGDSSMPSTIEALAATHVPDLVARFGDQPVHLVGYSGAGTFLVHEIARQLLDVGARLGFVCLIDFGPVHLRHGGEPRRYRPPGAWPDRAPSDLDIVSRLRYYAHLLRDARPGDRLRQASRLVDTPRLHDLAMARLDLRRRGVVRPELRSTVAWYRMMDALVAYRHRPIDASAVLLVSDQTAKGNLAVHRKLDYPSLIEPLLGWGPYLRDVERREIVGQHNDLMEEPYLGGVGAAIRRAFDDWLTTHDAGR